MSAKKKRGDEWYTPPETYNRVRDYVLKKFPEYTGKIVRPFYPGGDYKSCPYGQNCLVLDNPPFSITAEICRFYNSHNIKYFLFYDGRTAFTGLYGYAPGIILTGARICYENGKGGTLRVFTCFLTNLVEGIYLDGCILPGVKPRSKRKPQKKQYALWNSIRLWYFTDLDKVYKIPYTKSMINGEIYGKGVEIDQRDIAARAVISDALKELGDRWLGG